MFLKVLSACAPDTSSLFRTSFYFFIFKNLNSVAFEHVREKLVQSMWFDEPNRLLLQQLSCHVFHNAVLYGHIDWIVCYNSFVLTEVSLGGFQVLFTTLELNLESLELLYNFMKLKFLFSNAPCTALFQLWRSLLEILQLGATLGCGFIRTVMIVAQSVHLRLSVEASQFLIRQWFVMICQFVDGMLHNFALFQAKLHLVWAIHQLGLVS